MKRTNLNPEDEYQHIPSSDNPLWREGYHFNGYDPSCRMGITASMGIRPLTGVKNDFVMVHVKDIFLFLDRRKLQQNALQMGSLKIEPVVPFQRLRTSMKDSFQRIENGNFTDTREEVEFDLWFESKIPPCGHVVNRFSIDKGIRYEQPGFLRGSVRIGDTSMYFRGSGIRDHSWEIRHLSKWSNWYGMMGWFESGVAVNFVYIECGSETFCEGWWRTDTYHDVINAQMDPVTREKSFKEHHITVETSNEKLEMSSQIFSSITIPVGEHSRMTEILVELEHDSGNGYGFLWYGKSK